MCYTCRSGKYRGSLRTPPQIVTKEMVGRRLMSCVYVCTSYMHQYIQNDNSSIQAVSNGSPESLTEERGKGGSSVPLQPATNHPLATHTTPNTTEANNGSKIAENISSQTSSALTIAGIYIMSHTVCGCLSWYLTISCSLYTVNVLS